MCSGYQLVREILSDLGDVGGIFPNTDVSINSNSIIECRRRGKFNSIKMIPLLILVRMARPIDIHRADLKESRRELM